MSDRWYSSGRGIFRQGGGFQIATASIVPNWQEDTKMLVSLLNRGEEYDDLRAQLAKANARAERYERALKAIQIDDPPYRDTCLKRLVDAALASGGKP